MLPCSPVANIPQSLVGAAGIHAASRSELEVLLLFSGSYNSRLVATAVPSLARRGTFGPREGQRYVERNVGSTLKPWYF